MKKIAKGELFAFSYESTHWTAVGVTLELGDIFKLYFFYENDNYYVIGKRSKPNFYEGQLRASYTVNKDEIVGKVFIWVYENELGIVINGQWIEKNITDELFGRFRWDK